MKWKFKSSRGFTMIEMVVVISLVLILLSIALPMYNQAIVRAKEARLHHNVAKLNELVETYSLDKKQAPQALQDLVSAGYLKYMDDAARVDDIANSKSPAHEAMQAAKDSTIALLSYKPDTVEQQLGAARDLLTGDFRDSYTSLTNDVVIPGAKQKQISAVATVPAVASVSAEASHAVVLVFVNQTVIVGQDAPTDTASSVRVTLDKIGDRWLISKFDPV